MRRAPLIAPEAQRGRAAARPQPFFVAFTFEDYGLPPLDTGPGFQILLSADLVKLFPDLARRLGMAPARQRRRPR